MFQTQTLTTPILTPNLKLFDDMATDYSSLIASSSISASDSLRSQANFSMPAIDSSQLNAYSGEALPNAMDVAMTNSSGALNMSASHLFHLNSLQSDASSARSSSQSPQIQSDHIQLLQQQQHHQQLQQQSPLFSSKSFAMGGMFGRQQKALHNHFGQMNGLYGNELTGFNYQNDPTDLVIAESDEQSEQMEDSNASSSDMSELKYAAKNFTSSSVAGVGMAVLHGTLPSSAQYQHQQMQQAYGNKFSAQSMAAVATNLNLFSTLPANLMPMQFNKPNLDLESSLSSSFASNFDSKPVGKRTSGRRPNNSTEEKLSPEDEQRRQLRRERNKEAAARCRKRRVDHTNSLQQEADSLEENRSELKKQIELLQKQAGELQFILNTHSCQSPSLAIQSNYLLNQLEHM